MTPDELIDELWSMLRAQRFREMGDLTVRVLPEVQSQMTPDHAGRLHELMHFADTAVDLEEAAAVREQAGSDA